MSWYLILYIFAAVVIGTYPTTTLFQSGRTVSAITYVILALIVLIFFGLRWFAYTDSGSPTASWPPIINMCPDYLTFFKRPSMSDGSGFTPSCIDLVGVSRNGGIAQWQSSFSSENPPTDDKYYFSLVTNSNSLAARNQELCARAIDKGLTWEGITNGESCYAAAVPGSAAATAAESSNCKPAT
jgi:hypothetical protein